MEALVAVIKIFMAGDNAPKPTTGDLPNRIAGVKDRIAAAKAEQVAARAKEHEAQTHEDASAVHGNIESYVWYANKKYKGLSLTAAELAGLYVRAMNGDRADYDTAVEAIWLGDDDGDLAETKQEMEENLEYLLRNFTGQ